jgi:hypothetical protein
MPSFVLPVASGALVLTGAAVALVNPHELPVDSGSFALTGAAVGLVHGGPRRLLAESGVFAVIGGDVGLVQGVDPLTAVENAIHAWVVIGSGLDADRVIWTGDGPSGPQPAGTFISMRIIDDNTGFRDWLLPRREGNGIRYRIRSHHMATLELSCNADGSFGSQRGAMILRRVIAARALPSVVESMRGVVGIGPAGKIRLIPGVRSTLLDPKAMVEVGIHMVTEISEPGSAIETVSVATTTDVGTRSGTVSRP